MIIIKGSAVIRVEEEILKSFRVAVVKKHGKLYGFLKREINKPLLTHEKELEEES